jgi:outer membrane protein assembly factor BamE (lipoprotein component of BamABCDE complex)
LSANVKRLKVGMTAQSVKAQLGEPNSVNM